MLGYQTVLLKKDIQVGKQYRVVGISFEHMHMGDNLRMVHQHPACEIVGICDPDHAAMQDAIANFGLTSSQVFLDWRKCVEATRPDFVILCPSTGDHAVWIERLAPYGLPLLLEKPMAESLADADRMMQQCELHQVPLAINWPLAWVPAHRTAKRLVDETRIGRLLEVHYYGGNRGPLWHSADKKELSAEAVERAKVDSWFYKKSAGGGSMLDYLGYGTTLGTWFHGGAKPVEVTATTYGAADLEVDEHSIAVARYEFGISKFETRWGTFTDPWIHQPQPKCGFTLVGTHGTLTSYDYESEVRLQDQEHPEGVSIAADVLQAPFQNPVQYFVHCLETGRAIEGPLSPAMSRIGQQIVDTACQSVAQKRSLPLVQ